MTLKEMAKLLRAPVLVCETVELPAPIEFQPCDHAQKTGKTLLECLKDGKCPVCGFLVSPEIDLIDTNLTHYWCSKDSNHVFEYDDETGTTERIPF